MGSDQSTQTFFPDCACVFIGVQNISIGYKINDVISDHGTGTIRKKGLCTLVRALCWLDVYKHDKHDTLLCAPARSLLQPGDLSAGMNIFSLCFLLVKCRLSCRH